MEYIWYKYKSFHAKGLREVGKQKNGAISGPDLPGTEVGCAPPSDSALHLAELKPTTIWSDYSILF